MIFPSIPSGWLRQEIPNRVANRAIAWPRLIPRPVSVCTPECRTRSEIAATKARRAAKRLARKCVECDAIIREWSESRAEVLFDRVFRSGSFRTTQDDIAIPFGKRIVTPLALVLLAASHPLVTRPPIDPARLPLAQARDLAGWEVLVTDPAVGMFEGTFDGWDVYDLAADDGGERYLYVGEGTRPGDLVNAVFVVRVVTRPAGVRPDGLPQPARTSVRLFAVP